MHIFQPKHIRLKPEEAKVLLAKYNISIAQLPKVKESDSCVPEGCQRGDILKIERKINNEIREYFRVVI